jgi:hypothetical membrane protein
MAERSRSTVRCRWELRRTQPDDLRGFGALGFAALFAACALQGGCTETRGPSTSEERARFVALVRSLESDPLAENTNAIRQQLRDWAMDVPDIRFKVCPSLLGDEAGNHRYSREVTLQVMLSGAVLTIEHPGQARDDARVYTAGVEGALRAYDVLVNSTSDARSTVLDDLVQKRDRGELFDHIAKLAREKCPRSNALLMATPVGAAAGLLLALLVTHWFGRRGASHQAEPTVVSPSATRIATIRTVVFICVGYYMVAGLALHVLEPEYDPRFHFMSDYAWGTSGWLMTTTFFVLGVAVLAVAIGIRDLHQSSRSARMGFGLLVIGAAFVSLAGIFRGFPLHDIASAVAIPSLVLAAVLVSWSFRTEAKWQAIYPATFLISMGAFGAVLSMVIDIGMPGLEQRAFLFLLLLWLSIVAHKLVRVTAGVIQRPYPPATSRPTLP